MPALSPGITASLVLAPGDSYTVSAVGGSTTVKGIYGAPSTTTTLASTNQVFGPYGVPAKLDVTCVSGTADYGLEGYEGVPIYGKPNSVTGKLEILDPETGLPMSLGGSSRLPKTGVLKKALHGFIPVAVPVVTNPYSMMGVCALEAHFDSVRIGVINAAGASVAGVNVMVCAGSTLGAGVDALPASMGLYDTASGGDDSPIGRVKTWNKHLGMTLDAAVVASGTTGGVDLGGPQASVTWSNSLTCPSVDRADGGILPLLYYGISYPAGVSRTYLEMDTTPSTGVAQGATLDQQGDATTAPYGRVHRCMIQNAKDWVTTQGWTTLANAGKLRDHRQFPPVIIEYTLRGGAIGRQLVVFDDSTGHINQFGCAGMAWPQEFQVIASTMAAPVEVANFSIASSVMDMWLAKMNIMVPHFPNSVIMVKNWSPNNALTPMTSVNLGDARGVSGKMAVVVANQPTSVLVRKTMDPVNFAVKSYGASDSFRVAHNNFLRASGMPYLDSDAAMSTPTVDVNGQYTLKSGFDDSGGIHYSPTGHKAIAAALAVTWTSA